MMMWRYATEEECKAYWRSVNTRHDRERRSDMRTVEYEIWKTEKRDEKGEVIRGEGRITKGELFTNASNSEASDGWREIVLQDNLDKLADHEPPLKLTDVEVRARPFP